MIALFLRIWLSDLEDSLWVRGVLERHIRYCTQANDIDFPKATQILRAAVTGSLVSPPIFEVIEILGRADTLGRLDDVLPQEYRNQVQGKTGAWREKGWRPERTDT